MTGEHSVVFPATTLFLGVSTALPATRRQVVCRRHAKSQSLRSGPGRRLDGRLGLSQKSDNGPNATSVESVPYAVAIGV